MDGWVRVTLPLLYRVVGSEKLGVACAETSFTVGLLVLDVTRVKQATNTKLQSTLLHPGY